MHAHVGTHTNTNPFCVPLLCIHSKVFERILTKIAPILLLHGMKKRHRPDSVTAREALSFTLARLGRKGEAFPVAHEYGRRAPTFVKWFHIVIDAIFEVLSPGMRWPTRKDCERLLDIAGINFPLAIMAADGKDHNARWAAVCGMHVDCVR